MINFKNPCLDTLYKSEKPKTPQTTEQTKIQRKRKFQEQTEEKTKQN